MGVVDAISVRWFVKGIFAIISLSSSYALILPFPCIYSPSKTPKHFLNSCSTKSRSAFHKSSIVDLSRIDFSEWSSFISLLRLSIFSEEKVKIFIPSRYPYNLSFVSSICLLFDSSSFWLSELLSGNIYPYVKYFSSLNLWMMSSFLTLKISNLLEMIAEMNLCWLLSLSSFYCRHLSLSYFRLSYIM